MRFVFRDAGVPLCAVALVVGLSAGVLGLAHADAARQVARFDTTVHPALWPKVRAEFGQAVLVRLVAPATALADGATGAGALVVDIAVR